NSMFESYRRWWPAKDKPKKANRANVHQPKNRTHLFVEPLEDRNLLSVILWTNRGSATADSDGFNAVFGANAATARRIVDAAIASWEGVIDNFNYSDDQSNTFRMTVSMSNTGNPTTDDGLGAA